MNSTTSNMKTDIQIYTEPGKTPGDLGVRAKTSDYTPVNTHESET